MIRRTRAAALLVAAVLASGPAAGAQEDPTLEVTPAVVDAPGPHELTITGAGWGPPTPHFVLPCAVPGSGDVADVDTATCDSGALVSASVDPEGALSATMTVEVPASGVMIVAVNGDQSQIAGQVVEPDDGNGADDGADGELPDTGAGSDWLVVVALGVVAAGAMLAGSRSRRD